MTRDEYERYLEAVKAAPCVVDYLSFEVEVEDDYEEIFEIPGFWVSTIGGRFPEADDSILDQFPEVSEEFYRAAALDAEFAAADAYTRRAEQGFYDG